MVKKAQIAMHHTLLIHLIYQINGQGCIHKQFPLNSPAPSEVFVGAAEVSGLSSEHVCSNSKSKSHESWSDSAKESHSLSGTVDLL